MYMRQIRCGSVPGGVHNEAVMKLPETTEHEHKLARIYSERRQKEILLRIDYAVHQSGGCKVYQLHKIEELE